MVLAAICLHLSLSITMGFFGVTQRGYQQRDGGWKIPIFGTIAFLKGFFLWPYLFPRGLAKKKYRMNAFHKIAQHGFRD